MFRSERARYDSVAATVHSLALPSTQHALGADLRAVSNSSPSGGCDHWPRSRRAPGSRRLRTGIRAPRGTAVEPRHQVTELGLGPGPTPGVEEPDRLPGLIEIALDGSKRQRLTKHEVE